MASKTMSAPLAIIKKDGIPVGRMKNIRITETISRGSVIGLGKIEKSEAPVTGWNGTLQCGFYLIDFKNESINGSLLRKLQTTEEFANTLLLNEDGLTLDILKKEKDFTQANGVIVPKLTTFASIKGLFITSEGFDITEQQISGRDQSFEYLTPIIFPQ